MRGFPTLLLYWLGIGRWSSVRFMRGSEHISTPSSFKWTGCKFLMSSTLNKQKNICFFLNSHSCWLRHGLVFLSKGSVRPTFITATFQTEISRFDCNCCDERIYCGSKVNSCRAFIYSLMTWICTVDQLNVWWCWSSSEERQREYKMEEAII